jgi:hypothetical protein
MKYSLFSSSNSTKVKFNCGLLKPTGFGENFTQKFSIIVLDAFSKILNGTVY